MRLDVSALPVWHQRPRGFLDSFWSLVCVGTPYKLGLMSMKEYFRNRINELVSKSEGKEEKAISFSYALYPGYYKKVKNMR